MEQVTVINISWERVNPNEVSKLTSQNDYGIYQIYGNHPSYGTDVLLYIGKAQDQKFANRLHERWEFIECLSIMTHIRVGRLVESSKQEPLGWDKQKWKEMIGFAEIILIKTHTPALNSQHGKWVFSSDAKEFNYQHLLINNWEDYGKLLPEISTLRMSYKYWNFEKGISINE